MTVSSSHGGAHSSSHSPQIHALPQPPLNCLWIGETPPPGAILLQQNQNLIHHAPHLLPIDMHFPSTLSHFSSSHPLYKFLTNTFSGILTHGSTLFNAQLNVEDTQVLP